MQLTQPIPCSPAHRTPIRVFVIDDHEVVRVGLRALLTPEQDIVVVGEAGTAREAVAAVLRARPDIAIIDLELGDGNGVEVCRELQQEAPAVRCLVLTGFGGGDSVAHLSALGVAGFVRKERAAADLVAALHAVAQGRRVFDAPMTRPAHPGIGVDRTLPFERLTGQERRILALIADGATNRRIAQELFLAEKTVKNYVSRLLAKLGMARRTEAAAYGARLMDSGQLASLA